MVYPIVKYGDAMLEKEAKNVTEFDTPELHKLIEDMFEYMYGAKGVGLAAPQIGISKKIAVIDCSNGEHANEKIVLINPIVIRVEGKQVGEGGCLSITTFWEQPAALIRRVTSSDSAPAAPDDACTWGTE